jgi:hypothetical protein
MASAMNGLPVDVPDKYKFQRPVRTPNIDRKEELLRPLSNGYSTAGDSVMRFVLPKKNIDLRDGYLRLYITLSKTGGTYIRLHQMAASIINKVRWCVGNVESSNEYWNRTQLFKYVTGTLPDVVQTIGQDLLGWGTQADRNAWGAATTEYTIPLDIGILQQGSLPLAFLEQDSDFYLELYLENPLWCVETDGTDPVITITNPRLIYHSVSSKDGSYEAGMRSDIQSGRLQLAYSEWATYQNPVNNNILEARINWNGNSLAAIAHVFVDQSSLSNPAVNDKFITWLKTFSNGTTIVDYQLQLGDGNWVPAEAIQCTGNAGRAYHNYLDYMGIWDSDARCQAPAPITLDSFNLDLFVMTNNLTNIPKDYYKRRMIFNQLSTMTSANNTLLRCNLTGIPPSQSVVYHFVNYGVLFSVTSSGKLVKHL